MGHLRVELIAICLLLVASCGSTEPESDLAEAELFEDLLEPGRIDQSVGAWRLEVQQGIAICMKAQGFDFIPSPERVMAEQDATRSTLPPREWAQRYGYGVVSGADDIWAVESDDPNLDALAELTDSETIQYVEILNGTPETPGCLETPMYNNGGADVLAAVDEFQAAHHKAMLAVSNHPALVEPYANWVECMRLHGFRVTSPAQSEQAYRDSVGYYFEPMLRDIIASGPETMVRYQEDGMATHPLYPHEELDVLQANEIRTAVADYECLAEHVSPTLDPLRDAANQKLIDQSGDALRLIGEVID